MANPYALAAKKLGKSVNEMRKLFEDHNPLKNINNPFDSTDSMVDPDPSTASNPWAPIDLSFTPEQNFQLLLLRTMYLRPLQTKSSSSSRLMVVVVTEDYLLWEGDELYQLKDANSLQMTNRPPPPAIGST